MKKILFAMTILAAVATTSAQQVPLIDRDLFFGTLRYPADN